MSQPNGLHLLRNLFSHNSKDREHNDVSSTPSQPPASENREEWKAYWKERGQPWRTEPEIDKKRKQELSQRRAIVPDIEKGIYPFKGMKLNRADVEWLLATHENGRGPVDWNDESQRERKGLDLRGADLSNSDLSGLPLTCMRGSLDAEEWSRSTLKPSEMAAVNLEKAFLNEVHLEGAKLRRANLKGAELYAAYMEEADLLLARLNEAFLFNAHLENANLRRANLEGANLEKAHLGGANLCLASFSGKTILENVSFANEKFGTALLADINWNDVNLEVVSWSQLKIPGDKQAAHSWKTNTGNERLEELDKAVRANRQLAVALQTQGLNEDAARFAYRAQVLNKNVLWFQLTQQGATLRQRMKALGGWLFSWFLFLLAGYGYRPGRSILAYLVIIFGFMGLYLLNAHFVAPHLRWDEALVLSVSSFHGRGFFSQDISLGDTYARLAAAEAIVGLFIEISFIATFTQRFLGK